PESFAHFELRVVVDQVTGHAPALLAGPDLLRADGCGALGRAEFRQRHLVALVDRAGGQFEGAASGEPAPPHRSWWWPGQWPVRGGHREADAVPGWEGLRNPVERDAHGVGPARLKRLGLLVTVAMGQVQQPVGDPC